MRRLPALAALFVLALAGPASAGVPKGAEWTESYLETTDGVRLHADVLRPKGLPDDARTPVILSVGPYTNHGGATGPDPAGDERPSTRFHDFLAGAKVFERGYTYVMVDLRGNGGSAGCNDWGGPGEQEDVRAAVEWAASQPWSTGKVGLLGKSYDGWTGLMGLVQSPEGLAAVVALEPVYDGYRYLYMNGVRFLNSLATPASFSLIDATPGHVGDTPEYHRNGTGPNAPCYAANVARQQSDDPAAPFWKARELVTRAKHSAVPLFLQQGYLESNTKPDAAWDVFNAVRGPKRGWFGMWDHVRAWEDVGRPPAIAFDQIARFLDHYVRGVPLVDAPVDKDPVVEVQTSDGTWRREDAWPPADARTFTTQLNAGTYSDDGTNDGTGEGAGNGVWTISLPLPHRAHVAGVPRISADAATVAPNANLVADVYAIDRAGEATLVSRGAHLLREGGRVEFDLYGDDWILPAGHRVGVLLTGSNAEWWTHVPTHSDVTISSAQISLPFLAYERKADLPGRTSGKLSAFKAQAPFAVAPDALRGGVNAAFALPPAQVPRPVAVPAPPAAVTPGRRLVARIASRRRRITVLGNAPPNARVRILLRRSGRTVARRTVRARLGAFRATFRVRKAGRYRATLSTRVSGGTLRARTKAKRIR